MRDFQSGLFCSIIAILILYCAITGQHAFAALGAGVESLINIWYYDQQWRNIKKKDSNETDYWKKFKKNWIGYFLALLMPVTIWFSAWQLTINVESYLK
jgi:hypothetical protein